MASAPTNGVEQAFEGVVFSQQVGVGWPSFCRKAVECGNQPEDQLGLEHFRGTADGGVLARSFVTALLARPWKVGVPCQDHLRECSRRAAALWDW